MLRLLVTPRWVGRLAFLVIVVLACAWLGSWQWGRAWVEVVRTPPAGLAALTDIHQVGQPVDQEQIGRRVSLSGVFDSERDLLVVDRQQSGRLGSWVLSAFEVDGAAGAVIPVVRGWLPAGDDIATAPEGRQDLVGWLEATESDALRERGREPLAVGQVEVVSSAELLSLWEPPLFQGFVIQAEPEPRPPLVEVSPPSLNSTRSADWQNVAYAVQWWLFGGFAIFWFVRMLRVELEDQVAEANMPASPSLDTMDGPAEHIERRVEE